jgi:hypothetical protein
MSFTTRKSGSRSHEKTSRTRSRAKFVASVEAVEERLLKTGTSAVSWSSGGVVHSDVFALGFDNSVYVSKDGGSFVSEGGYGTAISAGLDWLGNPEVYAIGQDKALWVNDNGTGWVSRGGGVTAIAATTNSTVFAIGTDNAVYKNYGWAGSWAWLGNNVTAIGAGTDTSGAPEVYAIGAGNNVLWTNDNGAGWVNCGGGAKAIAGATNSTFFIIGGDNALWMNRGGTWSDLGGIVKSISAGSDSLGNPEAYGIGTDNALYSNDNGNGYAYIGGYVTDIAAAGYGKAYVRCMDVDLIESTQSNQTYVMVGAVPLTNPASAVGYSPAPYTATLFSPSHNNQPNYLDMEQGYEGDCWLDAGLAEVACRAPQDITGMFTYLGWTVDKGGIVPEYSVRLYTPSGTAFAVQVDTMLPGGGTYYNRITTALGTTSLWTALVEKAYAEASALGLVPSVTPNQGNYDGMNNLNAAAGLTTITGQPVSPNAINPTNLAAAWNSGQFVVLCTTGAPYTCSTIVANHFYAMVGLNASPSYYRPNENPFQLFNPWGTESNGYAPGSTPGSTTTDYGLFDTNFAVLNLYFSEQDYGSSAAQPVITPLPTVNEPTDLVSLDAVLPRKVVKLGGFSNRLIESLRPAVGLRVVGGPIS